MPWQRTQRSQSAPWLDAGARSAQFAATPGIGQAVVRFFRRKSKQRHERLKHLPQSFYDINFYASSGNMGDLHWSMVWYYVDNRDFEGILWKAL